MHPRNIHFGYLNVAVSPHIYNNKVALRNENFFQSYKHVSSRGFLNEIRQSNGLPGPVPVLDAIYWILFLATSPPGLQPLEMNGNFTALPNGIFYQAQAGS